MKSLLIAFAVLLFSAPAFATYNAATVVSNEQQANGTYRLVLQFSGNAGEPVVKQDIIISASSTLIGLRDQAYRIAAELNAARAIATNANVQPGSSVTLTQATAPTPTAEQVWRGKLSRLMGMKRAIDAGVTSVSGAAYAALLADVIATWNETYAAGF